MRDLLIVNDFPPIIGGQAAYYYNLCRAINAKDFFILAPKIKGANSFDKLNTFNIIRKPYLINIPILEKLVKIIYPLFCSWKIIKKYNIEVVHCGHVLSTGIIGLVYKKLFLKPYIVYTHSADILEYQRNIILKFLLKKILCNASLVVANSKFTQQKVLNLNIPKRNTVLLYPRIDYKELSTLPNLESLYEKYPIRDKKILLSVNRLVERKGNDTVLKSLSNIIKRIPNIIYFIIGTGPYELKLQDLIKEYNLEKHVFIIKDASNELIKQFYYACDIFLMISREIKKRGDVEGFGIVFLEANAAGKPVIGGDSGGIRDAIVNNKTGLLVDPLDVKEIENAILRLLQDPNYANLLGVTGRDRVARQFDWRNGVKDLSIVRDVLVQSKKDKIKVVHIITRLDIGGSTTNTLETCARLDKDKYYVCLITGKTDNPSEDLAEWSWCNKISITVVSCLKRDIAILNDFLAFFRLLKLLKEFKPDIVHTHSSKAGLLGRWAAKFTGARSIIHTPHGHIFYGYFSPFITKIFIALEKLTSKITDKIITLTELGKTEHVKLKIANADKFICIPSGVDISKFKDIGFNSLPNDILAKVKDNFVFGTVARLETIKGQKFLIDAFAYIVDRFPKTVLLLVGEGPDREFLEKKVKVLGISDKVIFAGYHKNVAPFMNNIDVFVLPSLNEGMGRVIIEAMSSGCPVIATKTGGIPELINEGVDGLLVPIKDSEALAKAMLLLRKDPSKIWSMKQAVKNKSQNIFSLNHMVKSIDSLYQNVLKVKGGGEL